jgi:hypothetical protein
LIFARERVPAAKESAAAKQTVDDSRAALEIPARSSYVPTSPIGA